MAFDQNMNLMNNDLRPLNVPRTTTLVLNSNDEPPPPQLHIIAPPVITTTTATATNVNVEGFCPNPSQNVAAVNARSMTPVYYSPTVLPPPPDSRFVAFGYNNSPPPPPPPLVSDVSTWAPLVPLPVGPQPVRASPTIGLAGTKRIGSRVTNSSCADQTSDAGGDDSVSGKKVKFMCSFGGKILPRPSDSLLRYVGGQTRIISVRRNVTYNELVQKMEDVYGQPLVIKYQLPGEDLDSLVSVSCSDDLDNMMDENSKLIERSSDESVKLRMFLFSAAELDSSGMVRVVDLKDSGQIYIDAINGIVEGVVGGTVMRKESIASAASTQNSEMSAAEGIDNLILANKGVVTELPSTRIASPRENSAATSHENTPRLVCVKPNPDIYVESSSVPLVFPVAVQGLNQPPLSSQPIDIERSVPITLQQHNQQQQQLNFELQQQVAVELQHQQQQQHQQHQLDIELQQQQQQHQLGFDLQQPRVEFSSHGPHFQSHVTPHQTHTHYVQIPGQLGFPHGQLLTTPSSMTPHQFVPASHMSMNPQSSYVTLRPNTIQPMMPAQRQNVRLDTYSERSAFAPRFVQVPVDQNFNAQAQIPAAVVGGGFSWRPIPLSEHVTFSDGTIPLQQENIFEKGSVATADSSSVYHSPRLDDDIRAWQANAESLGVNTQSRFQGHMNQQFVMSHSDTVGLETEQNAIHQVSCANQYKIAVPPGTVGLANDPQSSHAMITGITPQYVQDVNPQQHLLSTQYRNQSDTLVDKFLYVDASPAGGDPFHIAECPVYASPNNYPDMVLKEKTLDCPTESDNLGLVQERKEAIGMLPSNMCVTNEKTRSPRYDEGPDLRPQQILATSSESDSIVGRPMLLDTRQLIPIEVPRYPDTDISFPNQFLPVTSHEVEVHALGNQVPFSHADSRISHMACEVSYGEMAFPGALSTYVTDKIQPVTEWKDETVWLQTNSNAPTSLSPPKRISDMQESSNSFFSDQDPWNMHHDTNSHPPIPNKTPTTTDEFQTRDPFVENGFENGRGTQVGLENENQSHSGPMNREFSLEHNQPSKGSAEEIIKQELQAVAEGVAASVLSPESASACEGNESDIQESQDRGTWSNTMEKQHRSKVEDMPTKLPEKAILGFPASDGIGRLQIILNNDLEELRELGSGTFGTVYHGKWRGTDVAIKRINERCFVGKPSEQERMRDDFWNEAINLADLHHPNVVAFYGVVLDGPGGSVATVTEFMVNGSLRTALQKNERNLDKRKRLLIAMDAAFGMEYLHGKKIVHFDLKSDNLLVNLRDQHRPICKVGDLGLSKVKCQTLISGGVRGTLPWMAPELLNGSSSLVSEKVDVFSFGIVMWELLTGDEPYADLHYGAIIGGIVSNTLRPPVPVSCDSEWRLLMEKCWSAEPSERPNFTEIANQLRAMAAKTPVKGQSNQQQN